MYGTQSPIVAKFPVVCTKLPFTNLSWSPNSTFSKALVTSFPPTKFFIGEATVALGYDSICIN